MERFFNLVDSDWIPVAAHGRVSLRRLFEDDSIKALGGNPVEKVAVFKLLLAIGQSAFTPKDEKEWKGTGLIDFRKKVLDYLKENYDCFWLYGEKPFLQMPAIQEAALKSFGDVMMHVATGNTSVVTEIQVEKPLDDAEKAMALLVLMGFAFGGKKTDNSVVLTKGYLGKSNDKGKPASGKFGPSIGFMGLQHSLFLEGSICNSVYLNLLSEEYISEMAMYPEGIGTAPWLLMPAGEDDEVAKKLKGSLMGRLIPLCRFCLIEGEKIHYSEGIAHPGYVDSVVDPTVSVDFSAKPKPKVLWIDPEKKPWRSLPALLSFIDTNKSVSFICHQLRAVGSRLSASEGFSIWSGGVRVSSNAGEQYLTGSDDFVESEIQLDASIFSGKATFFDNLTEEMAGLDNLSKILSGSVRKYYSCLLLDVDKTGIAANTCSVFWQMCESEFQSLVQACFSENPEDEMREKNAKFFGFVLQLYDEVCPNRQARQLEAWAKCRPNIKKGGENGRSEA